MTEEELAAELDSFTYSEEDLTAELDSFEYKPEEPQAPDVVPAPTPAMAKMLAPSDPGTPSGSVPPPAKVVHPTQAQPRQPQAQAKPTPSGMPGAPGWAAAEQARPEETLDRKQPEKPRQPLQPMADESEKTVGEPSAPATKTAEDLYGMTPAERKQYHKQKHMVDTVGRPVVEAAGSTLMDFLMGIDRAFDMPVRGVLNAISIPSLYGGGEEDPVKRSFIAIDKLRELDQQNPEWFHESDPFNSKGADVWPIITNPLKAWYKGEDKSGWRVMDDWARSYYIMEYLGAEKDGDQERMQWAVDSIKDPMKTEATARLIGGFLVEIFGSTMPFISLLGKTAKGNAVVDAIRAGDKFPDALAKSIIPAAEEIGEKAIKGSFEKPGVAKRVWRKVADELTGEGTTVVSRGIYDAKDLAGRVSKKIQKATTPAKVTLKEGLEAIVKGGPELVGGDNADKIIDIISRGLKKGDKPVDIAKAAVAKGLKEPADAMTAMARGQRDLFRIGNIPVIKGHKAAKVYNKFISKLMNYSVSSGRTVTYPFLNMYKLFNKTVKQGGGMLTDEQVKVADELIQLLTSRKATGASDVGEETFALVEKLEELGRATEGMDMKVFKETVQDYLGDKAEAYYKIHGGSAGARMTRTPGKVVLDVDKILGRGDQPAIEALSVMARKSKAKNVGDVKDFLMAHSSGDEKAIRGMFDKLGDGKKIEFDVRERVVLRPRKIKASDEVRKAAQDLKRDLMRADKSVYRGGKISGGLTTKAMHPSVAKGKGLPAIDLIDATPEGRRLLKTIKDPKLSTKARHRALQNFVNKQVVEASDTSVLLARRTKTIRKNLEALDKRLVTEAKKSLDFRSKAGKAKKAEIQKIIAEAGHQAKVDNILQQAKAYEEEAKVYEKHMAKLLGIDPKTGEFAERAKEVVKTRMASAMRLEESIYQAAKRTGKKLPAKSSTLKEFAPVIERRLKDVPPEVIEASDYFRATMKKYEHMEESRGLLSKKFTGSDEFQEYVTRVRTPEGHKYATDLLAGKTARGPGRYNIKHGYHKQRARGLVSADELGLKVARNEVTPQKANEIYRRAHPDFKGDMFVTDPGEIALTRGLRAIEVSTHADFLQDISKNFGKNLEALATDLGWKADDIAPENWEKFARAAGWRPVSKTKLKGTYVPREIADALEELGRPLDPAEMRMMYKTAKGALTLMRTQALASVRYNVRNIAGNVLNARTEGLGFKDLPEYYPKASSMMRGKEFTLDLPAYGKISSTDLNNISRNMGVGEAGMFARDIEEMGGLAGRLSLEGTRTAASRMKRMLNIASIDHPLYTFNRKVGMFLESQARNALFIKRLEDGNTFMQAWRSVNRAYFDYGDLSNFEHALKPHTFFYTFWKKNLSLQARSLVTKPDLYTPIHKLERMFDEKIKMESGMTAKQLAAHKRMTNDFMSEFKKENIPIMLKADPETGRSKVQILGYWHPVSDALEMLVPMKIMHNAIKEGGIAGIPKGAANSFIKAISMGKDMANPYYQMWVELALGVKMRDGKPIARYAGQVENVAGIPIPKLAANIVKKITFINDLNGWNPGGVFGTPTEGSIPGDIVKMLSPASKRAWEIAVKVADKDTPAKDIPWTKTERPREEDMFEGFTKQYEEDPLKSRAIQGLKLKRDVRKARGAMKLSPNVLTRSNIVTSVKDALKEFQKKGK